MFVNLHLFALFEIPATDPGENTGGAVLGAVGGVRSCRMEPVPIGHMSFRKVMGIRAGEVPPDGEENLQVLGQVPILIHPSVDNIILLGESHEAAGGDFPCNIHHHLEILVVYNVSRHMEAEESLSSSSGFHLELKDGGVGKEDREVSLIGIGCSLASGREAAGITGFVAGSRRIAGLAGW